MDKKMDKFEFEVMKMKIDEVIPYHKNPRKNKEAVKEVKKSLKKFGWQQCLVVDEKNVLVVGHTRLEAAKELKMEWVPVKVARGLSEAELKAYRIMDNRTSEFAEWDKDLLMEEMDDIFKLDLGLDAAFLGFEVQEVDQKGKKEDWDLSKVSDECVITIRIPLDRQVEVTDRLKGLEGAVVEISNVKKMEK
jgi:hypothetical protein